MNSIAYVQRFIEIISKDDEIANYYSDKLNWAQKRIEDWESDKVRVGVIGVTSSGKSTLINALLGSNILSSAIAPSSGQLVSCIYGNEFSARIRFEEKKDSVLKGKSFSTENLMEYSDERKNPRNIKKVRSIEIQSPLFDLDKDVLLIDSPGLDAYGLDIHEKITLETLVPTIDVCIYVTTMKTNSDEKTREILNVVAKYGCPLVIVQNMLDTVRPSPSGDKTSEQVANEHYRRVERIVKNSDVIDKDEVEIVQISAEYAKNWRLSKSGIENATISEEQYEKSNYEALISTVNDFLQRRKPEIERNRINSISDMIDEVKKRNDEEISGVVPTGQIDLDFLSIRQQIENVKQRAQDAFDRVKRRVELDVKALIQEINKADEYNIKSCIDKVNTHVTNTGTILHNAIKTSNEELIEIAALLNIPARDLMKTPSFDRFRNVTIEKKTETTSRRVKEKGVAAFFKRVGAFFTGSDEGYRIEKVTGVVVDLSETKRKMYGRLSEAMRCYEDSYDNWYEKSLCSTCDCILEDIEIRERAERKRREAAVRQEKFETFGYIIDVLDMEVKTAKKKNKNQEKLLSEVRSESKDIHSFEIDNYSKTLIDLSRIAFRNQHRKLFSEYVSKENLLNNDTVVVGWDRNCIDELIWQTGIIDPFIVCIPENKIRSSTDNTRKCYFVMINATQIGSAEKQIRELQLEQIINHEDFIFWVVQDFEEILNGNGLEECLQRVVQLQKSYLNDIPSVIWIVHRNPIYNLAYLELQYYQSMSIRDENEILACLKARYREYCTVEIIMNVEKMMRAQKQNFKEKWL